MVKNLIILMFMVVIVVMSAQAEVDGLYIETEKFFGTNRGQYIPKKSVPRYNFNLGLDLSDSLSITYAKSKITSILDQGQFRYVGLDTEVGFNTTFGVSAYYRHYSGHMLDAHKGKPGEFPQENVIGLRFNLIGK